MRPFFQVMLFSFRCRSTLTLSCHAVAYVYLCRQALTVPLPTDLTTVRIRVPVRADSHRTVCSIPAPLAEYVKTLTSYFITNFAIEKGLS